MHSQPTRTSSTNTAAQDPFCEAVALLQRCNFERDLDSICNRSASWVGLIDAGRSKEDKQPGEGRGVGRGDEGVMNKSSNKTVLSNSNDARRYT